ncbi:hypothetical protein [Streptomyces sp. NPDC054783]
MAIPIALILAITIADILSPQYILGPLLVVGPALTASFGGSRLTALIGAPAVSALVVISALTVLFCRLRERHSAEPRQVRSVAEAAQQVVLQPLPERIGTLRVAGVHRAATDQAHIGGGL